MSDDDTMRPRRAWQDDTSDPSPPEPSPPAQWPPAPPPPQPDTTPADDIFRPRRGASPEPEAVTPIPPPVFPRSAGEYGDGPGPAPRRSAMSSQTPPSPDDDATGSDRAPKSGWLSHTLTRWAIGGLVGAVAVGAVSYYVARGTDPGTFGSPEPSSSASVSPTAALVTEDSLVLGADLAEFAPADSWAVTATSTAVADHEGRVACLSTENPDQNPTSSLQRTLATSNDDQLAALHRIDAYASDAAADQVFSSRIAALSACGEVPARIVSASTVTGLGDRAFQITVALENQPTLFHTVLITRIGAALQMLDVARTGDPVDQASLAGALTRPQGDLCDAEGTECTVEPVVTDAVVPAVDPVGWLIPSDLPRIREGSGRWTASTPTDLTSVGMGCENMTIATEPGPTDRQQATYLMTQDDKTPATFGMDELRFSFDDADAARQFTKKLGNAIAECADRVNTAKVSELDAVEATGADDTKVTSRVFSVSQATADDTQVPYQLIVSTAGSTAVYTIVTVSDDYRFSEDQLSAVAERVAVRATQG